MNPAVELVSTGAELLNGSTLNSHAQTLGGQLRMLGFRLARDTTVPDDLDAIAEAVRGALARVDYVVVSGGLGPTSDDVTRDAVARVLNRGIILDRDSLEQMRIKYRRLGRELAPVSERQALVLEGAVVLPNSAGMAPGERLNFGAKTLFILPGPPQEFSAVLTEHVLPWLRAQALGVTPPREQRFLVCGLGESDIGARLEVEGFPRPGMEVAYCAMTGRVEVRLATSDADALARAAADVRRVLGACIYSEDGAEMEVVVGRLLAERRATVATAESCTGGLLGGRLTAAAGSSLYYPGGVIAYSNTVKIRELGVAPDLIARCGAVSEETARAMAVGVRERFGADYGVAVTGIAGPGGGTVDKPVGLVYLAVADAQATVARRHQFTGARARIRDWTVQFALDLLRRRLLEG